VGRGQASRAIGPSGDRRRSTRPLNRTLLTNISADRGENRAPPPAPTSKTNNDCQIKFELLQKKSKRKAARCLDRDPIGELHQGQRSDPPHQRAGHMTAPDHFAETQLNILRKRGSFSTRISVVNCILIASVTAAGSRFSPRSERSAAASGSKRGRCNVHSGLAWCFTQLKALRRSRLHPRHVGQSSHPRRRLDGSW
jgi:hypothetical protein